MKTEECNNWFTRNREIVNTLGEEEIKEETER